MVIDIIKLKNNLVDSIDIDSTYKFSKDELSNTDLIDIKDLKIKGKLFKNNLDDFIIELNIKGIMVIPCSVTLKPVDYPFNIDVCSNLTEEEFLQNFENTIDILPIIWENILMEIPMKVVSEDADISNLSGDGWRVITDEEKRPNPELEKLKDLL